MSTSEDLIISTLLQKLFLSIIQKSDKTLIGDYVNYFKKILSSRFYLIHTNESAIVNMLFDKAQKLHFSNSKNNIEKIERLQTLYSILCTKKVPTKRWACLYLLLGLSQGANEQQGFSSSILETILKKQNENRKDIPTDIMNPSQVTNKPIEIGIDQLMKQPSPIVVNVSKTAKIITERELINDLMFVFQGIDGHFVSYNSTKNAYCLNSIIPFNENIYDIVSVLGELGWLYRKVTKHLTFFNESKIPSQFIQSFSYAVQNELNEYYKLISFFKKKNYKEDKEQEFQQKVSSSSSVSQSSSSDDLSLKNLLLWTLEPIERMKWLAISCESVYTLRGTAIISQLYSYVNFSGAEPYLSKVLEEICKPFFSLIKNWIQYGDLQDPYKEFFVNVLDKISNDDIWRLKYQIIHKNIPNFMDKELSLKVFEIGKCVNFIKVHCNEPVYNLGNIKTKIQKELKALEIDKDTMEIDSIITNNHNKMIEENTITTPTEVIQPNKSVKPSKVIDIKSYRSCLSFLNQIEANEDMGMTFLSQLKIQVDLIHALVNKDLLDIIYNKFHFKENLNAINRYLLLGQGDMMQSFMESIFEDLKKQANFIYKHNLQASLAESIQNSNAKHNDPECLSKLDVKLLDASTGDIGWDIFVLEYNVSPPLTVIFNQTLLKEYQKLFFFFWRLKRIEYSQNHQIWRKFMTFSHTLKKNYGVMRSVINKSILFNQQIIHFVSNLHNFLALEVLETQYKKIIDILPSIDRIDTLIDAHRRFVENIIVQSLLNQENSVIYKKILEIFDLIFRFRTALDVLTTAFLEVHFESMRKTDDERSGFDTNAKFSEEASKQISILFEEYKTQVTDLIHAIELYGKGNMKFLAIKLDFNYYYTEVEKDNDHKRQQNRIDNIKAQEENMRLERGNYGNEDYDGEHHDEHGNEGQLTEKNNNNMNDNDENEDISMNQFNIQNIQGNYDDDDEEIIAPRKKTYEMRKEQENNEEQQYHYDDNEMEGFDEQGSYQQQFTTEQQLNEDKEDGNDDDNNNNTHNEHNNDDNNEDN